MNGRRLQFGVAVIEDKLYIVGGRDGLKTLNTVECYNPKNKSWTLMPPMSTHRHGLGKESYWSVMCDLNNQTKLMLMSIFRVINDHF